MLLTFLLIVLSVLATPATGLAADAGAPVGTDAYTPIAAVKSLGPDEIAALPAVCIRGVVTRCRPGAMFVQDDIAGIYVNVALAHARGLWPGRRDDKPAAPGDEVEIEGTLDRGGFAPPVLPRRIRVVGAGRLPKPRPVEPGRFFRGADDCNLVEVVGVVQGVTDHDNVWRMTVDAQGRTLLADVLKPVAGPDPERFVDAVVRFAGPAASVFTTRGEFIIPRIQVDQPEWLEILEPARATPFECPARPLDGLATFRADPVGGHRVRTQGVVVHAKPGLHIFLQGPARGIRVQTASVERIVPGDRVEVAGFLDHSWDVAGLANAVVRRLGAGPAPSPIDIAPLEILERNRRAAASAVMADPGDYEGCLVRFPATLVEVQRTIDGGLLVLDAAGTPVTATVDGSTLAGLDGPRAGSELMVTGIARVKWAFDPRKWPPRTAETVTLLVRSATDVDVVRAASWWTPQRLAGLVAAVAALLALAMGWVWLLRGQVARQAAVLAAETQSRHAAEVEFDAAIRERNRLAANLHDTVLQTVTGIGFQLQACRAAGGAGRDDGVDHSRIAERMVAHAIGQLRGTVWALHELPPDGQSLEEGVRALAERLAEEHRAVVRFDVEGRPVPLADSLAGTLLLVTQEAIHNAARHAAAGSIDVRLRYGPDGAVSVIVRDDGSGFVPIQHPDPTQGHFGIEVMIDRMQRIGGTLRIDSQPGAGTTVTATVHAAADLSDRPVTGLPSSNRIRT